MRKVNCRDKSENLDEIVILLILIIFSHVTVAKFEIRLGFWGLTTRFICFKSTWGLEVESSNTKYHRKKHDQKWWQHVSFVLNRFGGWKLKVQTQNMTGKNMTKSDDNTFHLFWIDLGVGSWKFKHKIWQEKTWPKVMKIEVFINSIAHFWI